MKRTIDTKMDYYNLLLASMTNYHNDPCDITKLALDFCRDFGLRVISSLPDKCKQAR